MNDKISLGQLVNMLIIYLIMQIMPEVFILGFIYALLAYWDLMRANGPKHIPIF